MEITALGASLLRGWVLFIGLSSSLCLCASALSEEMSFKLTSGESASARSISEQALGEKNLGPAYFVRTEVLRDKTAEEEARAERKVVVTHYRTEGDLTVLTTVNLTKKAAEAVETIPHLPTPLSEEEFKMAREMALAEPQVKEALGKEIERVKVEPLVLRTMADDDPLFGHRVVRLLFRVGKDYLSQPEVNVDLTTRKVMVEYRRP